jgi:hypothetical protein
MKRLLLIACLALCGSPTYADNMATALIDRWYNALGTANSAEFADLLADGANITLDDLEVIQSKSDFIASLDEWEDANKGTTIRHSIDTIIEHTLKSGEGTMVSVVVCYKFPSNEMLTQEDFAVEGDKIISSEQKTIADSCATFPK